MQKNLRLAMHIWDDLISTCHSLLPVFTPLLRFSLSIKCTPYME